MGYLYKVSSVGVLAEVKPSRSTITRSLPYAVSTLESYMNIGEKYFKFLGHFESAISQCPLVPVSPSHWNHYLVTLFIDHVKELVHPKCRISLHSNLPIRMCFVCHVISMIEAFTPKSVPTNTWSSRTLFPSKTEAQLYQCLGRSD
jgi:hypothetical protein